MTESPLPLFGEALARAERPALTPDTCTPAPTSANEHGQDIGLGLRNIAIIWGESAT
jgi:hypothetical protein